MYTYIEIQNGPEKGFTYLVRPNMRLGSVDCELPISDDQAPPLHSQVLLNDKNQFTLVCTNAVFDIKINGRSVKKVVLLSGITIQISNIILKIFKTDDLNNSALDPLKPKNIFNSFIKPNFLNSKETKELSPKELLKQSLFDLKVEKKNLSPSSNFRLFKKPIHLKIVSGPQADDEFIFSWGPRDFGPLSIEFPIEYPPFPSTLFTLTPSESHEIIFSTNHPDFARVCGHNEQSCVISISDKIEAGNSTIILSYLKDFGLNE